MPLPSGHLNWNQLHWLQALHPHCPDASDVTVIDGGDAQRNSAMPFHLAANTVHHQRSARPNHPTRVLDKADQGLHLSSHARLPIAPRPTIRGHAHMTP